MTIYYVRIDKKKKLLATTFLQALGFSRDEIISLFYDFDVILNLKEIIASVLLMMGLIGQRLEKGMFPDRRT